MLAEFKKFLATTLSIILLLPGAAISLIFLKPAVALAAETDVVINEILPNPVGAPDTDNERIELYNKSATEAVDISGWVLKDTPWEIIYTVPPSTILALGSFYLAALSGTPLGNNGQTVTLENSSGIIDSVTYPDMTTASGVSYARKPDGGTLFYKDPSPTIGASNGAPPLPSALAITSVGGTIVPNTLNSTNTNFTGSVTIPADEGITTVELFLDGGPFSPPILDTTIDSSATFDAGTATNSALRSLVSEGSHNLSARAMINGTPGGTSSSLAILADYTGPSSTVTTSGSFGPNTWPGSISGTANDTLSSVTSVSLEIRRPDGQYWNGAGWQAGVFDTLSAIGTISWNYGIGSANFVQEGTYTVTSKATDATGNVEATGVGTFTWDATAPPPPTINSVTTPVNANSQTVTGTSEANSLVTISGGTGTVSQQLTGGATSYSVSVPLNQNATNNLSVTATDAAGNTSQATQVLIAEDSTPPDVPTLLDPTSDKTINADKYTIKGSNEEKATIKIYKDSNNNNLIDAGEIVVATTETTATGFELEVYLEQDAANYFLVTATDLAGNESAPADVPAIVEDSQPPSTLTTTSPVSQKIKHDGELIFEGQTDPSAQVTVEIFSDSFKRSTIADAAGFWKIVIKAQEIGPGSHRAVITIVDLAGNKSQSLLGSFRILSPMPLISEEIARAALRAIVPEAKAAPPAEAKAPEGQIKAGEAPEEAAARTSRIVTLIALLIIALGVGTAGYYAYSWWAEGTQIREREALRPMEPEKKKRPRGRPKGRPRGGTPPSTRW